MNEFQLPDVVEAAACATINARCGSAYLHDIRGSMQALYSALELLGRSAKSGGDNRVKVERACDLAKRAIGFHEKSTLGVLELLTSANSPASVFEVERVVTDAVHFLRNDAAMRAVKISLTLEAKPLIHAERNKFQVLLVGLLAAAIDACVPATNLIVSVERREDFAVLSLGSRAGYDESFNPDWIHDPEVRLQSNELTFLFARSFLRINGGRLLLGNGPDTISVLQIYYPCVTAQA